MRVIGNFCLLSIILLFVGFFSTSCSSDDENEDKVEQVTLYVSAETGTFYNVPNNDPEEGMLIKEKGNSLLDCVSFLEISGFTYERDNEYELLVKKTTLANPPQDAKNVKYELIKGCHRDWSTTSRLMHSFFVLRMIGE